MKIDMSPRAITLRLEQANQLRQTCLALARSSAVQNIRGKHKANESVGRASKAFGR